MFNGIAEEPYNKLIDFMNKNNNLIIKWTKVEGTMQSKDYYSNDSLPPELRSRILSKK